MRKILVTGGTVFVSRYVAKYFVQKGEDVYVLNRNTKKQPEGVTLIQADRNSLKDELKQEVFDVVIDVNSYNAKDITNLLKSLGSFKDYIFISSSAVYPQDEPQPFTEETKLGENKYWGFYGTDKIEAEQELLSLAKQAYILRPPYLYGPYNNVYREAFVFDCAKKNRTFYIPRHGEMKLQFFHVKDLCRCIEAIIEKRPETHIFNVGNKEAVSSLDWVKLCYEVAGKEATLKEVWKEINQRQYFSFYDYEYQLDVTKQDELIQETIPFKEGLKESYNWYQEHEKEVMKKDFLEYIDDVLLL